MASLAKAIDAAVAKNKSRRLAAVINLIGEPTDEYVAKAKAFAKKHNLKNVVVTVTADADKFNVNDEAEVTVMNYLRKRVKFNYAVGSGGLTKKDIEAIVAGIDEIL